MLDSSSSFLWVEEKSRTVDLHKTFLSIRPWKKASLMSLRTSVRFCLKNLYLLLHSVLISKTLIDIFAILPFDFIFTYLDQLLTQHSLVSSIAAINLILRQ